MNCFIGIDGGGSSTKCTIIDSSKTVISYGEFGASNYHTVGKSIALKALHESLYNAANSISLSFDQEVSIVGICIGLAGVGRPRGLQIANEMLYELANLPVRKLKWQLEPQSKLVCTDSEIALIGGLESCTGIAVISGTGSIIFGRNSNGVVKRAGGFGHALGDEGSAYDIALQGIRAALKCMDGQAEHTVLTTKFVKYLRLTSLEEFIDLFYSNEWTVKDTANLAPLICHAASEGDFVALQILESASSDLALSTKSVSDYLFGHDSAPNIVIVGGTWSGCSILFEKFSQKMKIFLPDSKITLPKNTPSYGAALKALNSFTV